MNKVMWSVVNDWKLLNTKQLSFLGAMLAVMLGLSYVWQDSVLNIVAGVTGVVCVFLVNMRMLSNYVWGVVNVILYGLAAYSANLYGDFALNIFLYLPLQFIGAYIWSNNMQDDRVVSKSLSVNQVELLASGLVVCVSLLYTVLNYFNGSQQMVDSFTTVASIAAMILMTFSFREHWIVWIAVNIASIYMWWVQAGINGEGYSLLIMWCMFLVNSSYGAYTWFKAGKV